MKDKRCSECGVIFPAVNDDQTMCCLCEDDRREEEDADNDYVRNWHRIRIYSRRHLYSKPGVCRSISGVLIRLMTWVNETFIGGVGKW